MCKHVRKRLPEVELTGPRSFDGRGPSTATVPHQGTGEEEPPAADHTSYSAMSWTGPRISMTTWHPRLHSPNLGTFLPGSDPHCVYSSHSYLHHITTIFFFLMCFPSSFSAIVINSNTPSLKCQSKLHRDLRRTIVCLYAQSINLNYS